ncbi:MAG: ABC-type transport auxiliary lipoprotein family protein [Chthoniobacterales bacterium]
MSKLRGVFILACSLAAVSCTLRQPAVRTDSFDFDLPSAPAGRPGGRSITVLPFTAAPGASGQMLLYRVDDVRYERDFYNRWLVPPAHLLTGGLRQWLGQARVGEIREPSSPLASDLIVQPRLTELYADYRNTSQPRAIVAMTIVVMQRQASVSRQVFERSYRREVPMIGISPEAAAEGWSRGVADILTAFAVDLRRVD